MANQPSRSISLPSREHPCSVRIEALLNHLKSVVPYEFETIQASLVGLAELYSCVEELIASPSSQQALFPTTKHGKVVEQALEGSITLLDTCNIARDLMPTMKEQVQTLQSALRRKGRDSSIETSIHTYLCFRKKAKKDIAKCLGGLKRMETKAIASQQQQQQQQGLVDLSMVEKTLRETSSITISIFRLLLKFVMAMPTTPSAMASGWSLISKMVRMKSLSYEKEETNTVNLVEGVDVCLHSLMGNIQSNGVEISQRMLQALDSSSEGILAGLNSMFRCLVQNRVSLLNIITQ